MPSTVIPGIDTFVSQRVRYGNLRLGMITNDAAATSMGIRSRKALLEAGFDLRVIFSPEHGIQVTGEDGVAQAHGTDPVTGLPLVSLYSEKLAPSDEDIEGLDLIVFDVPDVGCRFYTYLWTMTHAMEACARNGKSFMVLDRPNPIGALLEQAEGPMLNESACSSFIGRWNIPVKHSCTLGELALYFAATRMPGLHIQVIKVQDYRRAMSAWKDFPFVPTSPAIQNIHAASLYPGTGLWEGIFVNEGRGTDKPFEQLGAPWMNGVELCEHLKGVLSGADISPVQFVPAWGVYGGEHCEGVSFKVMNPVSFLPVQTGLQILGVIFQLYPQVEERLYKTLANPSGSGHMDKLLGQPNALQKLRNGQDFDIAVADRWYEQVKPYLLYE